MLAAAVAAAWHTPLAIPFKILVVFFHESAHLLTALATGGEVLEMRIVPQQGGSVLSRGGWPFLIASAGYLGSLLIGSALLVLSVVTRLDRIVLAILAGAMVWLTLRYMQGGYGWAFGLGTAGVMAAIALWAPQRLCDGLLRVIGLVSLAYVPLDIWSDTLARSHLMSDARILAMNYGGSTWLWGGLWLVLSALVVWWTLRFCLRHTRTAPTGTH